MTRFTKQLRQDIVREFAVRHNGTFNAKLFLEEVRQSGPSHPAFEWFEWDETAAALAFQLEQAREFARDLRVTFSVENVGRVAPLRVAVNEVPMVLSPLDGRKSGGGYYLTDPNNPEHMAEHCRQAASALEAWLRRYGSAVEYAGGSVQMLERQVRTLQVATTKVSNAA